THPDPSQTEADAVKTMVEKHRELMRQEEFLTAELVLARQPHPYLVLDIAGGTVELKARGRTLRSAPIRASAYGPSEKGNLISESITSRKPLQAIQRPQISAGAGEDAIVEIALKTSWGPDNMPADYDLIGENQTIIRVRSLPSEEAGSAVRRLFMPAYRRIAVWLGRQKAVDAGPGLQLTVWLDNDDSRLIFWSLPEKSAVLAILAGDGNR
ncbi:MAG TPA: hypothetical protein VLL97_09910, partial [Acidobacteriota bacterium]|nr:hypothetical protein [Acidobacteriota bacterium]